MEDAMALKLVTMKAEDMNLVMHWRTMPEVTKYMYSSPTISEEDQMRWFHSISQNVSMKYWIIEMDDTKIGVLNLSNIDLTNRRAAWAYYIADTSFRGRSIGTLLECNVYDYVFETLGLHKLCCEVFAFNEKVVSIHEKFGSEVEGRLKDHIFKDGEYYDIILMGITQNKWSEIKGSFSYEHIEIE